MNKSVKLSLGILIGVLTIINCNGMVKITEIAKPTDKADVRQALPQGAIPASCEEVPFVETAPTPKFTEIEQKRGFILFKRAISDIVYPNTLPKNHERINFLSGFACHNQFEPITFSIYPNRKLKNLKVRVSDLKQGKNIIPSSNISVKLQTYWKIPPHYREKKMWSWFPELLEKVTVHSSPAKQCQRYWITVKTPPSAKAGLYTGAIIVWDDTYAKAVKIPIIFRVMSFELQRDPTKNFTAYYYDLLWQYDSKKKTKEENDFLIKGAINNYKSMIDHGFTTLPMVYVYYDSKKDEIYARNGDVIMQSAQKAGFDFKNISFVPVSVGNAIVGIIRKYEKNYNKGSHWKNSEDIELKPIITEKITELFTKFNKEWLAKGYPQIFCCPLDEISPAVWKFGSRFSAAVKKTGMKIYLTKNPSSSDARHYEKIIDAFCPQGFDPPDYKKVASSKRLEYWSYPNHNAWEVRIPTVMCNGGRMTYGFGFWRSGFSTLIPWAWSNWRSKIPTTYIAPTLAGNPTDKNGEVIDTTYWECFREGITDGRYIYTLQKAILEHEKNTDKKCQELCKAGRNLLQNIWNNIIPELKYKGLETVSILPQDFDKLRWQMAEITEKLSKYKEQKIANIPSVIVGTNQSNKVENVIKKAKRNDNLIIKDLGSEKFDLWKTITKEVTLTTTSEKVYSGDKSLKMTVEINHKSDGGGEKGKYAIGWPRIYAKFRKKQLDLTKYDFLTFKVLVDSDRSEVADDFTESYMTISSHEKNFKGPSLPLLGQVPEQKWLTVTIDLNKIIDKNLSLEPWKSINIIQFGVSEKQYADKTKITFYLDDISLISFKRPIIKKIISTSIILLPAERLNCGIQLMGEASVAPGTFKMSLSLLDRKGKCIAKAKVPLKDSQNIELNIKNISLGKYIMKAEIINKRGKVISKMTKKIDSLESPTQV